MEKEALIRNTIWGVLVSRPPALRAVAVPKYLREIVIVKQDEHRMTVFLALWGFHYKNRGSRPKAPPIIDVSAIAAIFDSAFQAVYIVSARSTGTHIVLELEEKP